MRSVSMKAGFTYSSVKNGLEKRPKTWESRSSSVDYPQL
jgi:hypothetical protein